MEIFFRQDGGAMAVYIYFQFIDTLILNEIIHIEWGRGNYHIFDLPDK